MTEQWVVVDKDGEFVPATNHESELAATGRAVCELRYKLNIREWWECLGKGYRCIKVKLTEVK